MHKCNLTPAPIVKGVKFVKFQCLRNQYETNEMKAVQYASVVGSLMYAQVCTRLDLAFVIRMLGRYQKNLGKPHRDGVKKALRYLQGTKCLMLVGYSDLDFLGCLDTEKFTS
jgi:hypothetical protein